jgi:membrane associated rhomboid family serine protease
MERFYTRQTITPERPNQLIKAILWTTVALSLLTVSLGQFLSYGPQQLLSFSPYGFQQYFLWQLVTYLFVLPPTPGLTLGFIITLLFNLYIIWVVGTWVINRIGKQAFALLYFGSGIFAGLCCLATMNFFGMDALVAGATPAIYALFVIWAMFFPDTELLFFFLFPMKSRWLVAGLILIPLLMSLSQREWVLFTLIAAGSFYGYCFGLLGLELNGPFVFSHRVEDRLIGIKRRLFKNSLSSKIVDIKTGKPVDSSDEEFMDEMLGKISLHGKESLTWRERRRMAKISKNKSANKR